MGRLFFLVPSLFLPASALAHEGHGPLRPGAPPSLGELQVPGLVLLGLVLAGLFGFRFLRRTAYVERVRAFSRNARLLLLRAPSVGLMVGLWNLLFNLYLLALGFDASFVAQMIALNWVAHGLVVIPAGMLSDMLGRRMTYLVAFAGTILFRVLRIVTFDPTLLLLYSAIGGATEGFHAIIGPPFMMEQSKPEERVHLFSVDSVLKTSSNFFGNIIGAGVPLGFAALAGVGGETEGALRAGLVASIPFMILGWLPIYFIEEKWERLSLRRWWQGVVSYRRIGMLGLTTGLMSIGLGFTAPFFNIFFATKLSATTQQVGLIFSLGSLAVAASTLLAPVLVSRLGRVRTITYIRTVGIPCAILLGMSDHLWVAALLYFAVLVLIGETFPNLGMVDPIYELFAMEVVKSSERGTTNGVIHAFKEFPMSIGAFFAGFLISRGSWSATFFLAAIFYLVSFALYLAYFRGVEKSLPEAAPAEAPALVPGLTPSR